MSSNQQYDNPKVIKNNPQYKSLNKKQGIVKAKTTYMLLDIKSSKSNKLKTHTANVHINDYVLLLSI